MRKETKFLKTGMSVFGSFIYVKKINFYFLHLIFKFNTYLKNSWSKILN